jgi:integrase
MPRDFTVKQVEKLRRGPPKLTRVRRNLYLDTRNGGASWSFRYMARNKPHDLGLGAYDLYSLDEVDDEARRLRRLVREGRDPIAERRAERRARQIERAKSVTFKDCADAYIAAHRAGWSPRHVSAWENSLRDHVLPLIGALPVAAIDTGLAVRVLEPIWYDKSVTAGRVRSRCELVLAWAATAGFRTGDNPFRWRAHLKNLLPGEERLHRVEHLPAMDYVDVPGFMARLRDRPGMAARALETAVLTVCRSNEVLGMKRVELDLSAGTWTLPVDRQKAGKEPRRIPLQRRLVEVFGALPRVAGNPFVFAGEREGRPIDRTAMLRLMRQLHLSATVHGARASFRSWAAEQTAFPHEVIETALGHAVGSAVSRAYQRSDLFERRRALAEAWSQFCSSPPRDDNVVVPLVAGGGR